MRAEHPAASGAFRAVSGRAVVADFDGGLVTSDAGALLLGQADTAVGPVARLAACFEDHRDGRFVEHSVRTLVGQRVFGIALGYEGSIDRDVVRGDPVMAVLAGKLRAKRRNCAPVAGKSTSNRLELGGSSPSGDSKIVHDGSAIADVSGTLFLDAHEAAPDRAVPGIDATDDPVHGSQEGRFSTARPIRASSSPRSPLARMTPAASMRTCPANAARWGTASRNASSTCSPTAHRRTACARTDSARVSRRWPVCCSAPCAASASPTLASPSPQIEAAHNTPFPSITETSPSRTARRQPTGAPTRPEIGGDRANRKIAADTAQRPSTQRPMGNPDRTLRQSGVRGAQTIDPYRCIDEDHAAAPPRRRGMSAMSGWRPPARIELRAASAPPATNGASMSAKAASTAAVKSASMS